MDRELRKVINQLLKQYMLIMLYWDGKEAIMLHDHWKYDDPIRKAKRVYIGRHKKPSKLHQCKPNLFYIHNPV